MMTTTRFSVATIGLSGLFELLGLAGVLAVDVTTPLTGTLAVAVDSLPGDDTELAVVQKHGMTLLTTSVRILSHSMCCSCRRGGSSE